MKWCEIFRSGVHKDSRGNERVWTPDDLKTIQKNFKEVNPDVPICCGHPKTNSPAYGWIADLKVAGNKLFANYKDVQDEFKTAVKKGLFKTRSISLTPDLVLRHVAFLGGQSPAVKGLEEFCFASDNENSFSIEFSDFDELNEPERVEEGAFAPSVENQLNDENKNLENKGEQKLTTEEELLGLKTSIEEKETRIKELEEQIKKQQDEKLVKEFEDFCDTAISDGHILPSQKNFVMSILSACKDETINFEDDGEKPATEIFKSFISGLKQINFEEVATSQSAAETKVINFEDSDEIKNAIVQVQKEYEAKGIVLTTIEALNKLDK